MKKDLEIRTLTERFFDGKTTLAEERRLYQLYSEAESLPADLALLREMMLDLETLSDGSQEESVSTPLASPRMSSCLLHAVRTER